MWRKKAKLSFAEKEKIFEDFKKVLEERKIPYSTKETELYKSIYVRNGEIRVELAPHSYMTREKEGVLEYWYGGWYGFPETLERLISLL